MKILSHYWGYLISCSKLLRRPLGELLTSYFFKMERFSMIERVWKKYLTANIENDEYSYVQAFWSRETLEKKIWWKYFSSN